MSSYIQNLLYLIAKEINKPSSAVDPFIKILEENWYDSRESLLDLDIKQYEQMKIPNRISQLIIQKIHQDIENQQQQQQQSQQEMYIQQQQNKLNQQPQQEIQQPVQQQTISQQNQAYKNIENCLNDFKDHIVSDQKYNDALDLLIKILYNIIVNQDNEKYKKIKINSKIFQQTIGKEYGSFELMQSMNFKIIDDEYIYESTNTDFLQFCMNLFTDQKQQTRIYILYKKIKTLMHLNNIQHQQRIIKQNQMKIVYQVFNKNYKQLLNKDKYDFQLKDMIKPITNRGVQLYEQQQQQYYQTQEEQEIKDDSVLKKAILSLTQQIDSQAHFSSKRKKEYEDILKRPLYLATLIKIKFPNGYILQAKFAPNETISELLKLIQNYLLPNIENWYIYISPPIVKMENKYLSQTFEELDCIPRALFYFNFYDQSQLTKKYLR